MPPGLALRTGTHYHHRDLFTLAARFGPASTRRGKPALSGALYGMPLEKEVISFLRSTFRSIWSMELLFLLLDDPSRCWSGPEMVSALRASELVVSQAVEPLVTAGLVVPEEDDCVHYGPVSDDLHQLVLATRALYLKSPDAVRRLIIRAQSDNLVAFADAFKFRKD
jgi:hypothetical protein